MPGAAVAVDLGEPAQAGHRTGPATARRAQNEHNAGEETSAAAELPASTTPERDLATINIQTRRLVEYALAVACALAVWCAWVDVLPALGNLNAKIWPTTVTLTEEVDNAQRRQDSGKRPKDLAMDHAWATFFWP